MVPWNAVAAHVLVVDDDPHILRILTDVLGKVISGEADAGLVYVTDVKAACDQVHGVQFPESAKAVNSYPIAVLSHGTHQATAGDFMDFVTGMRGQSILGAAGFGKR